MSDWAYVYLKGGAEYETTIFFEIQRRAGVDGRVDGGMEFERGSGAA